MTIRSSIRFRLTVWYGLVLFAALVAFSLMIWLSLRQRLLAEMDEGLADAATRVENFVTAEALEIPHVQLRDEMEEFSQALPAGDALQLRGDNGFKFHYPAVAPARPGPVHVVDRTFHAGNETFRLRIESSLLPVSHTLQLLGWLFLSLVPVVVAVACIGGAWLSGRALQPVDAITRSAQAIGIDNLSLRLASPGTGDELERLTEVWNSMLARLEAAVSMLSRFAADASHELRTPLAIIRTNAELALRRARTPDSYRESLREIWQESERMTQLVEDLLFLARSDAGAAMPGETLDLGSVLREAVDEMRRLAALRRIHIRLDRSGTSFVNGSAPALRRLFLVLLDNAVKYSQPESEVLASLSAGTVSIRDFGSGIPLPDQPRIFDRFYQADKARHDGGFGLGLSLARSIAAEHSAVIAVESSPGEGSLFRIAFPLVAPPPAGANMEVENANRHRHDLV